jgi:predicted DNA-binding transcriptional regulator AlpA
MADDLKYIRVAEIARLSGHTVGTIYQFNYSRAHGFPHPCRAIGATKFWDRKEIMAWIAERAAAPAPTRRRKCGVMRFRVSVS